jgi:hypothetical protein
MAVLLTDVIETNHESVLAGEAEATDLIAGKPFGFGRLHYLRRLAAESRGKASPVQECRSRIGHTEKRADRRGVRCAAHEGLTQRSSPNMKI